MEDCEQSTSSEETVVLGFFRQTFAISFADICSFLGGTNNNCRFRGSIVYRPNDFFGGRGEGVGKERDWGRYSSTQDWSQSNYVQKKP